MNWWCQQCAMFCPVHADTKDNPNPHMNHKEKIFGIRPDILIDSMTRLVSDLKLMGRLERFK